MSRLKPDLSMSIRTGGDTRWLIFEVKGVQRKVRHYARSALRELFAYRRAFGPAFGSSEQAYGIGVAWGEGMTPVHDHEVVLCTPDTIEDALRGLLEGVGDQAVRARGHHRRHARHDS